MQTRLRLLQLQRGHGSAVATAALNRPVRPIHTGVVHRGARSGRGQQGGHMTIWEAAPGRGRWEMSPMSVRPGPAADRFAYLTGLDVIHRRLPRSFPAQPKIDGTFPRR
ncbi:hypothetical protein AAFF_G00304890 [Aldrovandia affinis]|uniref:Uncharacterized protein n=1 Tax=Aldrovandia affinis TaxID=143900 RepID=A0AAD7WRF4_9TELE|nr:hypothetical protein AAFF_G00304890 [Aldrovandia affinis]